MMKKISRLLSLCILSLTLGACVTTSMKLQQPIPKTEKITVIPLMENKASFTYRGFTVFGNKEFSQTLPGFNMNRVATSAAITVLKRRGYTNVSSLSVPAASEKMTAECDPLLGLGLTKKCSSYLRSAVGKRRVGTVVLLTPGGIEIRRRNVGALLGYGVYGERMFGGVKNYAFSGLGVSVIDPSLTKLLGSQSNDTGLKRLNVGGIDWKGGYAGIPANVISEIKMNVRTGLNTAMGDSFTKMGL